MPASSPDRLAYYLLKAVAKAQRVYRLFEPGDRIAVAVSGGKDSATLLDLLRRWEGVPRFSLVAVHVRVEGACASGIDPVQLQAWWHDLGIEGVIVTSEPAESNAPRERQGPCFHCSWRRRKALFLAAQQLSCNKVALGHHADDVAVTTLLNLFYQGRCETMPARLSLFEGALTLIRPLYLIEEREIVRFVRSGAFPFAPATCYDGENQRRAYLAAVLRQLEREIRHIKRSLLNAVERPASSSAPAALELSE